MGALIKREMTWTRIMKTSMGPPRPLRKKNPPPFKIHKVWNNDPEEKEGGRTGKGRTGRGGACEGRAPRHGVPRAKGCKNRTSEPTSAA